MGCEYGVPMSEYLEIDAVGSTALGWLAVSPRHYRYMRDNPPEETDARRRGTALHNLLLEPHESLRRYVEEPDLDAVAPGSAKPRATAAYRQAVAALEATGRTVLKAEEFAAVRAMVESIRGHEVAGRLIERTTEREVTATWHRNEGRTLCRGRFDAYGAGLMVDVKTTRSLRGFSPFELTRYGYYRQAAWYRDGARRIGLELRHYYLVAVEATPPHDVGVFVVEPDVMDVGMTECESLLELLRECLDADLWPGMFPRLETAALTDATWNAALGQGGGD